MNDVSIIIPARFKSTRFPGKPLIDLKGRPMVIRVADICAKVLNRNNVYIATDSEKIASAASSFGYNYIMTGEDNLTGTDRTAEASLQIDSNIIINVQGDEPLILENDIIKVIEEKKADLNYIINAMTRFNATDNSVNIPKVVVNEKNELLYISRALIPASKSGKKDNYYYKQVCIYAFTKDELKVFKNFKRKSLIESIEDIEILRFFELNKKIKMVEVSDSSIAIDIREDVDKVIKLL